MDNDVIQDLMQTVESINSNLDVAPNSWQNQLQVVRSTTVSLAFLDTSPNESRKSWQLLLTGTFQRVAFADSDNGPVQDIADWCLRQLLVLLQIYPEDVDVLDLIGRNWLSRAQKSLANIHRDQGSSSSEGSINTWGERQTRALAEAEERLDTPDCVEARAILQPATEYLQRAVNTARMHDRLTGTMLATAAEAFMSLGNVTSIKINDRYFEQASSYLQTAAKLPDYSLPPHLQHYLDEYGLIYKLD